MYESVDVPALSCRKFKGVIGSANIGHFNVWGVAPSTFGVVVNMTLLRYLRKQRHFYVNLM